MPILVGLVFIFFCYLRYFNRQCKRSDIDSNTIDLEYILKMLPLYVEFGKITNGKTEKLKAEAAVSLIEGMEVQTGMHV